MGGVGCLDEVDEAQSQSERSVSNDIAIPHHKIRATQTSYEMVSVYTVCMLALCSHGLNQRTHFRKTTDTIATGAAV